MLHRGRGHHIGRGHRRRSSCGNEVCGRERFYKRTRELDKRPRGVVLQQPPGEFATVPQIGMPLALTLVGLAQAGCVRHCQTDGRRGQEGSGRQGRLEGGTRGDEIEGTDLGQEEAREIERSAQSLKHTREHTCQRTSVKISRSSRPSTSTSRTCRDVTGPGSEPVGKRGFMGKGRMWQASDVGDAASLGASCRGATGVHVG